MQVSGRLCLSKVPDSMAVVCVCLWFVLSLFPGSSIQRPPMVAGVHRAATSLPVRPLWWPLCMRKALKECKAWFSAMSNGFEARQPRRCSLASLQGGGFKFEVSPSTFWQSLRACVTASPGPVCVWVYLGNPGLLAWGIPGSVGMFVSPSVPGSLDRLGDHSLAMDMPPPPCGQPLCNRYVRLC